MANLSQLDAGRSTMVSVGCWQALVRVCAAPKQHKKVVVYSLSALANLSQGREVRVAMAEQGLISDLVRWVQGANVGATPVTDPKALGNAALVLANLALDSTNHSRLVRDGAVDLLVRLCSERDEEVSGRWKSGGKHKMKVFKQ